jgi:hypothetical protein
LLNAKQIASRISNQDERSGSAREKISLKLFRSEDRTNHTVCARNYFPNKLGFVSEGRAKIACEAIMIALLHMLQATKLLQT